MNTESRAPRISSRYRSRTAFGASFGPLKRPSAPPMGRARGGPRPRALEAREAVVPLPPRVVEALADAQSRLGTGVDQRIEGMVEEVLRSDVGAAAVCDPTVDDDDLAVIDVELVDGDGGADLRADRAQARIREVGPRVIVDVGVDQFDAVLANEVAE